MNKIGYAIALIGLGGLPETYGHIDKMVIALSLIIIGGLLLYIGENNEKWNDHSHIKYHDGSRPYYLR